MEYEFSWSWMFIGMLIVAAGTALVVWYRPIADNFGNGVGSYERFRLWGLIGIGVGLAVMLNLHSLLLSLLFSSIFGGMSQA